MRAFKLLPVALVCTAFLSGGNPARGAGGVNLTVTNNTTDDLALTIYDLNTRPVQKVLTRDVINGFATLRISVTPDGSGQGHVSWKAATVGGGALARCGGRDRSGLQEGDDVHVYANAACGGK